MKTNEIDLTQCNNCRFRAVVDGKEVTGRIEKSKRSFLLTGDDVFGCAVTPAELENLLRGVDLTVEDEGSYISGFEIEPRDPETCKDWQVGDKVCEKEHRNACYEVIFCSGELVIFKDWNNYASNPMTCSEAFTKFGLRLVLTDIERRIIEKRKKAEWKPQDGDYEEQQEE